MRTRDWVKPWNAPGSPGKFQLLINGKALNTIFGTELANWHWQKGQVINIKKGNTELSLHDLTGFEGRCDAILFTDNLKLSPPNKDPEMALFRRKLLGYPEVIATQGKYDLIVVGGGIAGCTTAISAARLGIKVALIQDRPVLGGNNSSEVRVGASGQVHQKPYRKLGSIVDEIIPASYWNISDARKQPELPLSKIILSALKKHPEKSIHNGGPASNYEDQSKEDLVRAEKNIDLFLNMHVNAVEMDKNNIKSVIAQNIKTGERFKFDANLFADCTGDGTLGYLAKANFRVGRESETRTGESLAPKVGDKLSMGTSVMWYAKKEKQVSTFPLCPWAVPFNINNCRKTTKGKWQWETGTNKNQITEIEYIRDYFLRVIYGNWATLKNDKTLKEKYAKWQLDWVAYIGGKRESRRLLGDVILTQQDIQNQKQYPDAAVTTTWSLDLHYPIKIKNFGCESFLSKAVQIDIKPYPIPLRTLYSRNINNLMMAGRNISVTHIALGTIRVMRTTGMMGEVLGIVAKLTKKYSCTPRDIYNNHLDEFKLMLNKGLPSIYNK